MRSNMAKNKKKYVEPQFIHDNKGRPSKVYLTIDDYNALVNKLKKLSKIVCGEEIEVSEKK